MGRQKLQSPDTELPTSFITPHISFWSSENRDAVWSNRISSENFLKITTLLNNRFMGMESNTPSNVA